MDDSGLISVTGSSLPRPFRIFPQWSDSVKAPGNLDIIGVVTVEQREESQSGRWAQSFG